MARINRDYAIVLGGLALGTLIAGTSLISLASAGMNAETPSPLLTQHNDLVSAFECKKGIDGTYDWAIAEPRTKRHAGVGTLRTAVPDLSPRHTGSTARIKQEILAEQALPHRLAEPAPVETKLCDAGQGSNRHG